MLASGIEVRLYFPPAHRQPVFAGARAELPVTEDLSRRMLSLPFYARLTNRQLEEVATTLATALESAGAHEAVL
jgi:perosamine synthetase